MFHVPPLLVALALSGAPAEELTLSDHAQLSASLAGIASAHPDVASLIAVGTSREGRALEALRISGTDAPGKPAILLVANLEGPDVFDSAIALDHAQQLAGRLRQQ